MSCGLDAGGQGSRFLPCQLVSGLLPGLSLLLQIGLGAAFFRKPGLLLQVGLPCPVETLLILRPQCSAAGLFGTAYLLADLPAREVLTDLVHRRIRADLG